MKVEHNALLSISHHLKLQRMKTENIEQAAKDIAEFVRLVNAGGQMSKSLMNKSPDYIMQMREYHEGYVKHYTSLKELANNSSVETSIAEIKSNAMRRQIEKIIIKNQ